MLGEGVSAVGAEEGRGGGGDVVGAEPLPRPQEQQVLAQRYRVSIPLPEGQSSGQQPQDPTQLGLGQYGALAQPKERALCDREGRGRK